MIATNSGGGGGGANGDELVSHKVKQMKMLLVCTHSGLR